MKSMLFILLAMAACSTPQAQNCEGKTHLNSGFYTYTFNLDGCNTRARLEAEGKAM